MPEHNPETDRDAILDACGVNSTSPEEFVWIEGFDTCVIGIAGLALVYDWDRILDLLVEQGLSAEDADEHIRFNFIDGGCIDGRPAPLVVRLRSDLQLGGSAPRTLPPHHGVPGMRARAHAATNMILGAAHAWWASRRPLSFTLHQHLQHPTINTCSESERELAEAVAEWIQAATAPGTLPDMPYEPRRDADGRVIGFTRARTPLEAALFRSGLSVAQLARQLGVRERALHRWCAGAKPHAPYRKLLEEWMARQLGIAADTADLENAWTPRKHRP